MPRAVAALAAAGIGLVSLSGCGSGGPTPAPSPPSPSTTPAPSPPSPSTTPAPTPSPSPPASIPTVTLNNGVEMPVIAVGSGSPNKGFLNSTAAEATVRLALEVGYTHVDTAHSYNNQEGVRRALMGRSRDSFFLTTKVEAASAPGDAYDFTMAKLEDNLVQLNMSYVDLVEIHMPPSDNNCRVQQEQWRALEDFYKANKTRAIGVSNYCVSSFECVLQTATVVPMVNQIEYHVGLANDTAELKSYAKEHGIQLMAYAPLGSDKHASSLITGNLTKSIGLPHNKTGPQAALRWVLQTGVAMVAGSSSKKHLEENIDMFDWELTDEDVAIFNAQTEPGGYHWAPCDPKHPHHTVV